MPRTLPRLLHHTALILAAVLLLGACSGEKKAEVKKQRGVPVTVAPAVKETTSLVITAVGNVQPQATVAIKTQVGGTLVEQHVKDGQSVKTGDLLFRLDPRPFELTIREAQARLERNRVLLQKAAKDLQRYSQLNKINAVAQEQYDKTFADTKSLESDIQLNLATLERARLDLSFTVIKAPISGNVGMVQITEGNVIKANDDRTLCIINQLEPITVSFALPERFLPEIMQMQQDGAVAVQISPATGGGQDTATKASTTPPLAAMLSAMDNSVDTTTGTIKLRAQYANTDHRLWPGQFVRIGLVLREKADAILIPTSAVLDGANGSYVYVITTDNKAEARPIVVDFFSGDRSVITSGVSVGELVVLDGQVRLAPGTAVEIKNAKPSAKPDTPSPAGNSIGTAKGE